MAHKGQWESLAHGEREREREKESDRGRERERKIHRLETHFNSSKLPRNFVPAN